jgi:hypothetical protein
MAKGNNSQKNDKKNKKQSKNSKKGSQSSSTLQVQQPVVIGKPAKDK